MKNLNLYKLTSITGLCFGTNQRVDLGKGLVFLKDSPYYNEDGSHYFSYVVQDIKTGDIKSAGSANTLNELKQAAKSLKVR